MADANANLLESFRTACEHEFAFLTSELGFKKEVRVSDAAVRPWRTISAGTASGAFWAIARFTRGPVRIEIGYGDHQLNVEGRYWYQDLDREFGLWEIVEAASGRDVGAGRTEPVTSVSTLSKTVSDMADGLKQNLGLFLEPQRDVLDRASALREQRLRQARAQERLHKQERLRNLERARVQAAHELRTKNYSGVITLLYPYVDLLTDADRENIALSLKGIKAK